MKATPLTRSAVALIAALALSPFAAAQTTITTTTANPAVVATTGERVVTTTTRVGRVGTVTPDMVVMEAASGTEPVPYMRTTRTVFVDEAGAVVPQEMIRPGVPITVHYSQDADRYVADRVIVHRKVVNPAPAVVERTTVVEPARKPVLIEKKTTTTTTTAPAPAPVIVTEDDDDDD